MMGDFLERVEAIVDTPCGNFWACGCMMHRSGMSVYVCARGRGLILAAGNPWTQMGEGVRQHR